MITLTKEESDWLSSWQFSSVYLYIVARSINCNSSYIFAFRLSKRRLSRYLYRKPAFPRSGSVLFTITNAFNAMK